MSCDESADNREGMERWKKELRHTRRTVEVENRRCERRMGRKEEDGGEVRKSIMVYQSGNWTFRMTFSSSKSSVNHRLKFTFGR